MLLFIILTNDEEKGERAAVDIGLHNYDDDADVDVQNDKLIKYDEEGEEQKASTTTADADVTIHNDSTKADKRWRGKGGRCRQR